MAGLQPAVSPELLQWCLNGGVTFSGVEAGFVADGWRGVLATQDIAAGTCVLRVPRRLLMSVESARRDAELSAALSQHGAGLSSHQVLAVHLLHEAARGPRSFWHPYLRSLPPSYTTAMCLRDDEAAALQAPHAAAAARAAAAAAATAHVGALPLLRALALPPKWRGRGAWLWAASTLSSRTMFLPTDSAGALTPFGDLHNYCPPPPPYAPAPAQLLAGAAALGSAADPAAAGATTAAGGGDAAAVAGSGDAAAAAGAASSGAQEGEGLAGDGHLDEAGEQYCIVARATYRAGDQVYLCYGRHTNLGLLQHYGFVLDGNPHDVVPLARRLLPATVRQQLGGCCGGGEGEGSDACLHGSGAPCWGLLRALRLGCASLAERRAGAYLALRHEPISAASERAAFAALLAACEAALAELPTSAEEDEQLLVALNAAARQPAAAEEQQQRLAVTCSEPGHQERQPPPPGLQRAGGGAAAAAPACSDPQRLERLRVVVRWRLGHKRTLHRGASLCKAVLAALDGPQAPAPPDIDTRLAGLRRTPRW